MVWCGVVWFSACVTFQFSNIQLPNSKLKAPKIQNSKLQTPNLVTFQLSTQKRIEQDRRSRVSRVSHPQSSYSVSFSFLSQRIVFIQMKQSSVSRPKDMHCSDCLTVETGVVKCKMYLLISSMYRVQCTM